MPLYEFRCQNCNTTFSVLVKNVAELVIVGCSACGSNALTRVISSFAYHKSMKTIWAESGEPLSSPHSDYYKDPRNIGRWTEKRFGRLGLDMPSQVKEDIQAAREGELPDSLKE